MKKINLKRNPDRIVKYNTKKIVIITSIVVTLIVGVSLGIYFAVRKPSPKFPGMKRADHKQVRSFIKDSSENVEDIYAIYLHNDKSEDDKDMLYTYDDIKEEHDNQKLTGPFGKYTVSDAAGVNWISISKSDDHDLKKELSKALFGTKEDEIDNIIETSVFHYLDKIETGTPFNSETKIADGKEMLDVIDVGDWNEEDKFHNFTIANEDVTGSTWIWLKGGNIKLVNSGVEFDRSTGWGVDVESYWQDAEAYMQWL